MMEFRSNTGIIANSKSNLSIFEKLLFFHDHGIFSLLFLGSFLLHLILVMIFGMISEFLKPELPPIRAKIGVRYLELPVKPIPIISSKKEILSDLSVGSVISNRITLPEGITSYQIVEILRRLDSLVGTIAKVPAEGSLAPNTYFYSNGQSRVSVLEKMKASQRSILKRTWQTRQANLLLRTPEELMILASIIEKESSNDSERMIIASVLHNRLKNNMRLQADPTVIYGITAGKGSLGRRLLKSDLKKPSVYNTYMIDGLPKTPICNPGEASLWAAANPVSTNYFYYVANAKGGHAFAETLEEHNKNVRIWRKLRDASVGN